MAFRLFTAHLHGGFTLFSLPCVFGFVFVFVCTCALARICESVYVTKAFSS